MLLLRFAGTSLMPLNYFRVNATVIWQLYLFSYYIFLVKFVNYISSTLKVTYSLISS